MICDSSVTEMIVCRLNGQTSIPDRNIVIFPFIIASMMLQQFGTPMQFVQGFFPSE
jgi:hypothetical protein